MKPATVLDVDAARDAVDSVGFWLTVLVTFVSCVLLVALTISHVSLSNKIDRIQNQLCGFVFYEDGSVVVETDDDARYACMKG